MDKLFTWVKNLDLGSKISYGVLVLSVIICMLILSSRMNNSSKVTNVATTVTPTVIKTNKTTTVTPTKIVVSTVTPKVTSGVSSQIITPTKLPTPTLIPTLTPTPKPTLIPTETPIPTIIPTSKPTIIYPVGVRVSVNKVNLYPGEKQQITATVLPDNAYNKNIIWTYDENIISVEPSGLITAKNPGKTTIFLKSSNNKTNSIQVTINSTTTSTLTSTPTFRPNSSLTPTPTPTKKPTPTPTKKPTPTPTKKSSSSSSSSGSSSSGSSSSGSSSSGSSYASYSSQQGTLVAKSDMGYKYWLYTPKKITTKMPLVIYLHGSGERGSDLNKLLKEYQVPGIIKSGKNYNAYIVSPQSTNNWGKETSDIKKFIDYIVSTYDIDKSRISITGHSLGAYGAYFVVAKNPGFFSCFVPVATSGISHSYVSSLAKTKIWAFHGSADKTTSPSKQTDLINAIIKSGGNAKITIIPGGGHTITKNVYIDNNMINWMIAQKK